ncbi:MAG: hypothetical protein QM654_02690 [Dysgonamonadaceae bacterium]
MPHHLLVNLPEGVVDLQFGYTSQFRCYQKSSPGLWATIIFRYFPAYVTTSCDESNSAAKKDSQRNQG